MPASASNKSNRHDDNRTARALLPPPLPPPPFSALPSDLLRLGVGGTASHPSSSSRYELWSVRIPAHVDPVALLDGTTLELKGALLAASGDAIGGQTESSAATLGSIVSSAIEGGGGAGGTNDDQEEGEGEAHALMIGHDAEAASYRVLVKGGGGGSASASASGSSEKSKTKDNDDDDDDDDGSDSDSSSSSATSSSSSSDGDSEKEDADDQRSDMPPSARRIAARHAQPEYQLRPLPLSFDRHLSLVVLPPGGSEAYHDMTLAPSAERAPEWTTGDQTVKVAYVPVRQVQGLKRRWMPVGAGGGADKLGVDRPRVGNEAAMKCVGAFGNSEASTAQSGEAAPAKKARVVDLAQESKSKSTGKKDKKSAKKDKKKRKGKD